MQFVPDLQAKTSAGKLDLRCKRTDVLFEASKTVNPLDWLKSGKGDVNAFSPK